MAIYKRGQDTAKRLLDKFQQGAISHVRDGAPTGPEWDPQPGLPDVTPVVGAVRGVSQHYVGHPLENGMMITQSDLMATLPEFGIDPSTSDRLNIDGRDYAIIKVERIPAAGTLIVWKVFIR